MPSEADEFSLLGKINFPTKKFAFLSREIFMSISDGLYLSTIFTLRTNELSIP